MSDSDPGNIYSGSESSNGNVYDAPVASALQRTLSTNEFYGKNLRPRQPKQQVPHQPGGSSGSSEKDDSDTDKHYFPQKDLSPKKVISPKKPLPLKGRGSVKRPRPQRGSKAQQRVLSPDSLAETPRSRPRGRPRGKTPGLTRGPSKQRRLIPQRASDSSGKNVIIIILKLY